ncbi:DSC E3 ubiquitin ligase complex subunit 3 [Vanrija pseudolonga]|uniref:DSC E3 ubiquitin ligase complex subunit 3 n=1 Tax=Vanrija pseudolonga TaxID=143232 RepID=A0AAF1BF37_9TREE|nr:DSC E3 ubiquitin ligase complex subunit 3 [Vanrija pseudolonga]
MSSPPQEDQPLLPPGTHLTAAASRSKLQARRYLTPPEGPPSPKSEKARGKQRAVDTSDEDEPAVPKAKGKARKAEAGRAVTVIFSNEEAGGNLEVWVEDGESVGHVKENIRHLRPSLAGLQLRLIHAGRLLTDGILLLPWLRSLEERVRRQAAGVGGDVGEVLREVGLTDEGADKPRPPEKIYLHCNVGGPQAAGESTPSDAAEEAPAPRRRGFDALLDAGLSPEEVAQMRRQFYESRGEEVPDGLDAGDVNDEHARALEEQWIEGDLTPATATTSTEGMYTSILHGLLIGFLVPLTPWFFFRDPPLPNFFDAEAEATDLRRREEEAQRAEDERRARVHAVAMGLAVPRDDSARPSTDTTGNASPSTPSLLEAIAPTQQPSTSTTDTVSARVSSSPLVGAEVVSSVVFGKRMQIGVILGTIINVLTGVARFVLTPG